jgi:glycosidase
MRGMGKTRADLLQFLELTGKKGIRVIGDLNMNDISIFEHDKLKKADDDLLKAYMDNGYMPQVEGTLEEGTEFSAKLKKFWQK